MDVDFPYSCSPGLLGSSGGSTTALCNGLVMPQSDAQLFITALPSAAHCPACVYACWAWQCPAGSFCGERTINPEVCPPGHFCPSGSSLPRPCPAGSWSSAYGLTSAAECTACPRGSECEVGSISPRRCATKLGLGSWQAAARGHAHRHTCSGVDLLLFCYLLNLPGPFSVDGTGALPAHMLQTKAPRLAFIVRAASTKTRAARRRA